MPLCGGVKYHKMKWIALLHLRHINYCYNFMWKSPHADKEHNQIVNLEIFNKSSHLKSSGAS